jgi:hypothetical protein
MSERCSPKKKNSLYDSTTFSLDALLMNLLIVVQVVGNECWSCWFSRLMMVLPYSFSKDDHKQKLGFNFSFFSRIFNRAQNPVVFYVRAIFSHYYKTTYRMIQRTMQNLDVQQINGMIQNTKT